MAAATTAMSLQDLPRFPSLTENNRDVFNWSMALLDGHASLPLFWGNAKASAWYCAALLARGRRKDVEMALQYIENILTQQYTRKGEVTYGTYKGCYTTLWAGDDSLAKPKIYDTYDPNNALFVTMAFIIIEAKFADSIPDPLLRRMREAMYIAVLGDEDRVGGVNEDNLRPAYTNPWYMRIVCSAYVGNMMGDAAMMARSDGYLKETMVLFDLHRTISEYNSPTYTGVTLMALGVTQFLPEAFSARVKGSEVIREIWRQIGMTYNATLTNLSGAWDRTYGYDMTLYVSGLGAAISNVTGMSERIPLPNPLAPGLHLGDAAAIPVMCLLSPYLEAHLPSETRTAFTKLQPHLHTSQAFSPPYDKNSRQYSYYVGDGYSVGGIEFDECEPGGPSLNIDCFAPGVILWDTGRVGNSVGWISYVPTSACCSIVADANSLKISYPPSKDFPKVPRSNIIRLHISTFPDLQLSCDTFSTPELSAVSLPGMNICLTGNVVRGAKPKLRYTGDSLHGWQYYVLEYELPESMIQGSSVPELVIELERAEVERNMALLGTSMPDFKPTSERHVVNEPPVLNLSCLRQEDLAAEDADALINLMREGLVSLKDETGQFLYKFEDGSVVDTKSWLGWDWTQGVALAALVHHAKASPSAASASLSLETATQWFEAQHRITNGKGAQKNINTTSAFYSLGCMLQDGSLRDSGDKNWTGWLDDWMSWVADDQTGLPRTTDGGFQHVTYETANHNQLWDDTLFMTCIPLGRASICLKRPEYLQLAIFQFLLHSDYLGDVRTGLWFHGWQFEDGVGSIGHNFAEAKWARGNCWVTIALPMLLELMDEAGLQEDGVKTKLIQLWRRQVDALLRLQNFDNGMWHTILNDPESYVETSATAGFVAGIFMGLRLGIVELSAVAAYTNSALRGLRAVIGQVGTSGEIYNVSFGTPMGHTMQFYRDIPLTSMPYGQALAMLALVEWMRWRPSA